MPPVITLGTALLDEFEWLPPAVGDVEPSSSSPTPAPARPNELRIGGGGVYAALGARIWLPPSGVGCVVHRGPDFPAEVQEQLDTFGEEMWHFVDVETPTPRALNTYHPPSPSRHFRLLTPPPVLSLSSFPSSPSSSPSYIHLCSPPSHLSAILSTLPSSPSPDQVNVRVVYEPLPPNCLPSSLPLLLPLFSHPSFFALSPNHLEATALLGLPESAVGGREGVESVGRRLRELGAERVVLRCGGWGCYWIDGESEGWVEAYHESEEGVRDTVGAGNAFLGGLLASLSLSLSLPSPSPSSPSLAEHCERASISASFVVEQVGLPTLSLSDSEGGGKEERWNGENPEERLRELRSRSTAATSGGKEGERGG
ncbi:Ribokinase-like protein [Leucosporidium creatinivorum]|uniref:Ribokinase-like protein n=1 Tax=Leucosporidium creatinivorum TaxID=106004 RepID=A0A1Y2G6I5_9BASI|nr:Ribokinase-like protein [Leucosporidium creatinivorum]